MRRCFFDFTRNGTKLHCVTNAVLFCLCSMILTAVFFRPMRKLSLNTERKSDGDAKAAVNLLLNLLLNTFWIFILYG